TDGSVDVVEMYDDIMTGTLEVHKTTEGMLNVEGISFVLSGTSDVGIEVELTAVTDENGIATFEAVPIGTYTITEDSETTPYAYLTADAVEVQVYYAQTTTQEVYNNEKTGTLEVHKTTEDMTNIEGIDFVLSGTSDSGREIEITATTDANGIAEFENIPIGTYTITEDGDTVPYGYLTADDVSVEVYYAETTVQEVYNEEIPETETDTPKTPNLKTGTALLGTASLLGVVILVISFRKKKNE
ncbi:MAG: hypothetical protein LUE12_03440, partial [Ruminococcus sp.]|nr:hypothetical protein [Ruminococcus sp.]